MDLHGLLQGELYLFFYLYQPVKLIRVSYPVERPENEVDCKLLIFLSQPHIKNDKDVEDCTGACH
jgi:hypothetical protein